MKSTEITHIRQMLPETIHFPYYADRESPWLLAQMMTRRARVADLRAGPAGKLLGRPLVKPLVARCGGELRQRDVISLAYAQEAIGFQDMSRPARAKLDEIYGADWLGFTLTFTAWGMHDPAHWMQMSRDGGNLVVQLGFPADHAEVMGKYLKADTRHKFEEWDHPVRSTGSPTLAWARLDIDKDEGVALIEEVQCDWLRNVQLEVLKLDREPLRSREARSTRLYDAHLRERYGRGWSRAMLLSVLLVLRDYLGIRDVFMHRFEPGNVLKGMEWDFPPVSLYRDLPKAFCFAPTDEAPEFLERLRRRDLAILREAGPVFWRLQI
ncbi:hypothetical protein [uncultured Shimia sp.]|uniref:hypothetical protein n=1 Tax=uncultured Shimia sp. TaxID=573152 RepID=UPI002616664F|nr:hypothetical protein [uncultured Shimia sp.]